MSNRPFYKMSNYGPIMYLYVRGRYVDNIRLVSGFFMSEEQIIRKTKLTLLRKYRQCIRYNKYWSKFI